jgi:hypothetical protein
MLEASFLVLAFSLFPLIPTKLGATPIISWCISAGAFLVVDLAVTVVSLRRLRDLRRVLTRGDRFHSVFIQLLAYSADALMAVVVLGIAAPLAPGLYFVALYVNLALAGLLFVAFAASTFLPVE